MFVGLLAFKCYSQFQERCERAGVTAEDLMQVGFIALMDAVKAFDPAKGYKFTTYLSMQCRQHFRITLGLRTERAAKELLNDFRSLNEPLTDDSEELECIDFIPDPDAQAPFEDIIDSVWRHELREAEEIVTLQAFFEKLGLWA